MTTRLPNLRTLEGIEQMKHRLLLAENKLKEQERKADAQRKIILGGSVNPVSRSNPALALLFLKEANKTITVPRDRKVVAEFLPGGSEWDKLVEAVRAGQDGPLKTVALEGIVSGKTSGDPSMKTGVQTAPVEAKTFATPAEKTAPIGAGSEQKLSGLPSAKPVEERPVLGQKLFAPSVAKPVEGGPVSEQKSSEIPAAKPVGNPAVGGGNLGGLVPRNPAGTVGQSTGSLPIPRPQNGPVEERPAARPIPSGFLKIGGKPIGEQPVEGGA